jgi:hypothetical protein
MHTMRGAIEKRSLSGVESGRFKDALGDVTPVGDIADERRITSTCVSPQNTLNFPQLAHRPREQNSLYR